jgi:hypothetical protein
MKPDSPFSESHLPLSAVLTTYNPIKPESAHFAYPKEKREEIVRNYREARLVGEIENKDAWARAYYGITGRTLLKYETEFPEES